jgi:hypothetical protein
MVGGYFTREAGGHTTHYLVTAYASGTSITVTDLDGVQDTQVVPLLTAAYNIASCYTDCSDKE